MKYLIKFRGRKIGAIGIFTNFSRVIEADSKEAAISKLYDTHEHISIKGKNIQCLTD